MIQQQTSATATASGLDQWNTVVGFVPVPFTGGRPDQKAFRKNCEYLAHRTWLDGARRALAVGGSSLIHHLEPDEQVELAVAMGEVAGDDALVLSGILPNPLGVARALIRRQMEANRSPDAFLMLPVAGTLNPDGVAETMLRFVDEVGAETGAKFFLYLRSTAQRSAVGRVAVESEHVLGVKVGTDESDVAPLVEQVGDHGMVMWGVGDRATSGIESGARGHTSGIAILFGRASDELNNAHRRADYDTARHLEGLIAPFEDVRFREGRMYNYSAVVEAARVSGFADIDCGEGGPFNAPPPPEVRAEIADLVQRLEEYH